MDLQITVRNSDVATLDQLAERDWRLRAQQASALLEAALSSARARIDKPERPRSAPRRTPARTNGVARVEA